MALVDSRELAQPTQDPAAGASTPAPGGLEQARLQRKLVARLQRRAASAVVQRRVRVTDQSHEGSTAEAFLARLPGPLRPLYQEWLHGHEEHQFSSEEELITALQEATLRGQVHERAETTPKRETMVAGVMDRQSGQTFFGTNTGRKPDHLHPFMTQRIARQEALVARYREVYEQAAEARLKLLADDGFEPAEIAAIAQRVIMREGQLARYRAGLRSEDFKTAWQASGLAEEKFRAGHLLESDWRGLKNEVGTHGEIHALNAALNATASGNNAPDLQGFLLYNEQLKPGKDKEPVMPRCHHCDTLTDGVALDQTLANAELNFKDRQKKPPAEEHKQ